MKYAHLGSNFDDFLPGQGTQETATAGLDQATRMRIEELAIEQIVSKRSASGVIVVRGKVCLARYNFAFGIAHVAMQLTKLIAARMTYLSVSSALIWTNQRTILSTVKASSGFSG